MKHFITLLCVILLGSLVYADNLADYLSEDDGAYKYKVANVQINSSQSVSVTYVDYTSQIYNGDTLNHSLQIYYPSTATVKDTALLLYVEGKCDNDWLQTIPYISQIMLCPIAVVYSNPKDVDANEYSVDTIKKMYTDKKYFQTPYYFSNTKTLLKAMDSIGNVTRELYDIPIDNFVLCSGNSNALSCWNLAGLGDKRIKALISVAFNSINMMEQLKYQVECYGAPSESFKDKGLKFTNINDSDVKDLIDICDPVRYIDKIEIPKLIISSVKNSNSTVDGVKFYYNDLKGVNHFYLMTENEDAVFPIKSSYKYSNLSKYLNEIYTIKTFFYYVTQDKKYEKTNFNWVKIDNGYKLEIDCNLSTVSAVYTYTCDAESKDFRYVTWNKKTLNKVGDNYSLEIKMPENSHRCAFVEVQYTNENNEKYSEFSIPFIIK